MIVGGAPDDLQRYSHLACSGSDDLLARLLRRTVPVLVSFPTFPGLEDRLTRFARGLSGLDGHVGLVGRLFAAADAASFIGPLLPGTRAVDEADLGAAALLACDITPRAARRLVAPLGHGDAMHLGRAVATRLAVITPALERADVTRLRRQLAPLRDKLREPYREAVADAYATGNAPAPDFPDDYAEVMLALSVPGPRRASVWHGVVAGAVAGAWDQRGFDNGWGEVGRGAGHLLSGVLVVGDVRDASADLWHRQWVDLGLDTVGLVPVLGDLAKGGRTATAAWQAWRDLSDAADTYQSLAEVSVVAGHLGRTAEAGAAACGPPGRASNEVGPP